MIGNPKAYAQIFHIVTYESVKWKDILEIYLSVIEEKTGIRPKVLMPKDSKLLQEAWHSKAQIEDDRLYDRKFDSSKIAMVCPTINYMPLEKGLKECLGHFLDNPKWRYMNAKNEAWADKYANEITPISEISGIKTKLKYMRYRFLDF